MDKKIKKKVDVLRQRKQVLLQQLAGAKKQDDEPGEIERLEQELSDCDAQLEKLKAM